MTIMALKNRKCYMAFREILMLLWEKIGQTGTRLHGVFATNREAKIVRRGLKRVKLRFCSC